MKLRFKLEVVEKRLEAVEKEFMEEQKESKSDALVMEYLK